MDWSQKIFAYCERGADPGFWAEPLNAVSNAAFLIAAAIAFAAWARQPATARGAAELVLIGLVAIIGIGSFLFHTYATRWAAVADTAPIGIFMLCYLGYALRRFAGLGWLAVAGGLAVFVAALYGAGQVRCGSGACLNGSLGYVPAVVALGLVGGGLLVRSHPAGSALIVGALLLAVSLALRTVDRDVCPWTVFSASRPLGTHFLWHVLNGTLLGLLLLAAVRHGRRIAGPGGNGA